jgi:hypothetical protein
MNSPVVGTIEITLKSDAFSYTRSFNADDAAAVEEAFETVTFVLQRFAGRPTRAKGSSGTEGRSRKSPMIPAGQAGPEPKG